jgi:DNA-binding GntR family transcriptional regulator
VNSRLDDLERPDPPYLQLVQRFRDQIKAGTYKDGQRLPPVRDIAKQFNVAHTTAAKAMRQLGAEGLVVSTSQGTFVAWGRTSTFTPRDRLNAMSRSGRIYPPSERAVIISAEVVPAPDHVAEAMLIPPGTPVVRRERVTMHDGTPVTHSISWLPGELAETVPALLDTGRNLGGTVTAITEATGRAVTHDTYRECARRATAHEARLLEIAEGDPVLAGQNTWYESPASVLEFGEYVIPQGRWVTVAD